MNTFEHPLGLSLQYPENWVLQPVESGLFVLPEGQEASSPMAFAIVNTLSASNITSLDDPAIQKHLADMLASDFPGFEQTGQQGDFSAAQGPGCYIDFSGFNLASGQNIQVRVFVTLYNGIAVVLVYMAEQSLFSEHAGSMQQIISSISGEAKTDENLVGTWHREESEMSDISYNGGIGNYVAGNWHYYYQFMDDGKLLYAGTSQVYAGSISEGEDTRCGKWMANGSLLHIIWDQGGEETWNYSVFQKDHGDFGMALKIENAETDTPRYFSRTVG